MTSFDIFPAIDLRGGQVVRLRQGDPQQQTTYAHDPILRAQRWRDAGARWVHIVNLDGAFGDATGGRTNRAALAQIAQSIKVPIQFGGGLRTMADIAAAFDAGVNRVVIGTAAIENPQLVEQTIARYGAERVVVGLDSRDGMIVTRGWQTDSQQRAIDVGAQMYDMGVRYALYTEVGRDGMLSGVAAEMTAALAQCTDLNVIASGGARDMRDIDELLLYAPRGVCGVIVGKALYEGTLDLAAALARVNQATRDNQTHV